MNAARVYRVRPAERLLVAVVAGPLGTLVAVWGASYLVLALQNQVGLLALAAISLGVFLVGVISAALIWLALSILFRARLELSDAGLSYRYAAGTVRLAWDDLERFGWKRMGRGGYVWGVYAAKAFTNMGRPEDFLRLEAFGPIPVVRIKRAPGREVDWQAFKQTALGGDLFERVPHLFP